MRRRLAAKGRTGIGAVLAALVLVVVARPASAAPIPEGYEVASRVEVAEGVEHLELRRAFPAAVVHVARIAPGAPVSLRAVLSNGRVAEDGPRLERTSSMCARVNCAVGVNGDFADLATQEPLGGLVTDGQLVRSPSPVHHQASLTADGRLVSGLFDWSARLVLTDLHALSITGVNVDPHADGIVLYTSAYGAALPPGDLAALVVRVVEPAGPVRLGQTSLVEVSAFHDQAGAFPIPPDAAVLAAGGERRAALAEAWARIGSGRAGSRALFRFESADGVVESLGGSPILIRSGRQWFTPADDNFTRGRHPRTLVGVTGDGELLLVTVDGRQQGHSLGMTLLEATDLMLALGATEAVNLDGGGSSTFVVHGSVANQPSDVVVRRGGQQQIAHAARSGDTVVGHVERPVASGLMVVPVTRAPVPQVDPLAVPDLSLPQALALPVPTADPGSAPGGDLPALATRNPLLPMTDTGEVFDVEAARPVLSTQPVPMASDRLRVVAVAAHAVLTTLMVWAWSRRRARPLPRDG